MNKNARLCCFAMQRTIITALLAFVAIAGQGQENVGGEDFVYLLPS